MSDPHIQAAFYLSPSVDQWWRWEDDAQVLAWEDGRTIAFTAEVLPVLDRLSGGGLPPFATITLLLAACHDDWEGSSHRKTIAQLCDRLSGSASKPQRAPNRAPAATRSAVATASGSSIVGSRIGAELRLLMDGLDTVARLPRPLRGPVAAMALLAEVVFETSKNRGSPADGRAIVDAVRSGLPGEALRPRLSTTPELTVFAEQVSEMAAGLARVHADALARRLQTGLDESIRPPEQELSPPEKVRRLLAELRSDDKLAGVARLAHDLMAAVAVPRALRLREELQLGGVSDLTNRGPLDRLLVSELAQDDLTLAVRVAVNEAMYLRRESPPKEPPHHRAILIDAGVRMWGVPRLFATAVALALSAMADPSAELSTYRASGADALPVDLTTRQGLLAHLAALETPAHPGGALPAFVTAATLTATASGDDAASDCFVITHADAAADPDFLTAIARLGLPSIYVGAIDRDGVFRLVARSRAGEKPVREAKMSLADVLGGRPAAAAEPAPLVDPSQQRNELPAIFFTDPFPLQLPYVVDPHRAATSRRYGLVAVSDDGRLLHWADDRHGARQLMHDMPRGQVRMLSFNDDLEQVHTVAVRGRDQIARLVVTDLEAKSRVLTLPLGYTAPTAAFQRGLFVFLVSPAGVEAFDIRSGRKVAAVRLPSNVMHHRGRYFVSGDDFFVIAYDGSPTLKLEPLATQFNPTAVFDREGYEGSWFVSQGKVGDQLKTLYPLPTHLPPHLLQDISPDGRLLMFHSAAVAFGKAYFVDLEAKAAVEEGRAHDWPTRRLGPAIHYSLRSPVQLRKKFRGIAGHGSHDLALDGGHGSRLLTVRGDRLELVPSSPDVAKSAPRAFEMFHTSATRAKLKIAQWPDGSRAWLDNRGLLHLRSSDRSVPELTVVLDEGHSPLTNAAAAWSSEGHVIGPEYFVGNGPQTNASYFVDVLRQFVQRLRD